MHNTYLNLSARLLQQNKLLYFYIRTPIFTKYEREFINSETYSRVQLYMLTVVLLGFTSTGVWNSLGYIPAAYSGVQESSRFLCYFLPPYCLGYIPTNACDCRDKERQKLKPTKLTNTVCTCYDFCSPGRYSRLKIVERLF